MSCSGFYKGIEGSQKGSHKVSKGVLRRGGGVRKGSELAVGEHDPLGVCPINAGMVFEKYKRKTAPYPKGPKIEKFNLA